VPGKGQHDAVAALHLLRTRGLDVELDLVGPGDPQFVAELHAAAERHGVGDHVRFVGPQGDPIPLVARADVALMCSRMEGLGRVTVEAMKLGKPVVGTAAGATPELIRHGWNGYLYRPGDASDLARRVAALYENREAAREMGQRAKGWANSTFNPDSYADGLEIGLRAAIAKADARR
jgi:glycosyltransferase involved in cell wall biosynthesis